MERFIKEYKQIGDNWFPRRIPKSRFESDCKERDRRDNFDRFIERRVRFRRTTRGESAIREHAEAEAVRGH